ncbi:transposase [Mycolicibacterium sp. (ex Dasyatis americana)]|nr:transposase [Mycolicibacterium sp. (ex Dasyatis americana)]OFB37151.1 transposase [Mycolicibacterium sp. (ex Dasyatis americana)]OFB38030.1 transposase [Mycolicibacterium sp. (ex Dasyatis americana)]OFB38036.1 transposase [Mycolicibacterium sp. (ex Dasyatis americana)]OFB38042.1 transposase [Mycolicibacterium sp. (ex Dasyatis americana)]
MEATRESLVSSAGGVLLRQTLACSGLQKAMSAALAPWRAPRSVHDPAKALCDLVVAVALGGDCAADIAIVRAQPDLFGAVASDATVSRLITTLAGDVDAVLAAICTARAAARQRVWRRQRPLPGAGNQVIVDLDATLVTAHSEKEGAAPTFKYGYGFHPMLAFVDHGVAGSGETLAGLLRPGSAGSNSAADHISVLDAALAQLPEHERAQVVVRTDTGGGVKDFLHHITDLKLQYSVGFYGMPPIVEALAKVPRQAWRAAVDGDGTPREGAQVAELTRYLPDTLKGWPAGMRVIARRERPHPGAQLRLTDDNGWRITCFATNTAGWTIADLEVRHRQRARAEDRIRNLKDTGLTNLPFHGFDQNQIWLQIALLAADLLVWTQVLAFHQHPVRRWEPKRLRLRLLAVAGRIISTGRRRFLRLPRGWPWSDLIETGWTALQTP